MKQTTFFLILFLNILFMNAQEKDVFETARSGTIAEMQALTKQNPDIINTTNSMGFSPLILACYRGNTDVAKYLIEHVKDVNYKSPEGTALAGLAIKFSQELAEALLHKKADPNIGDSTGTTPLIWAVKTGNEELVKLLLEHGAKIDQPDNMGIKPFEYAVQTRKENIINLLKTP